MQHFPIFLSLSDQRIVVSGGGMAALAKLRLLMKTEARLEVYAVSPASELVDWAADGRIVLHRRRLAAGDATGAALFYAANEDEVEDSRVADLARGEGVLVNVVDDLDASAFITPAIVDRDPVTVAIGTEGAAPILARAIKADLEAQLPQSLGPLARLAKGFRKMAEKLPHGRARRDFWTEYFFSAGPRAHAHGENDVEVALDNLLTTHLNKTPAEGHVAFVGAGPGDPELLTLKARNALDKADVVIYDRLVSPEILELARREAVLIDAGKEPFGKATPQEEINRMIVDHAGKGAQVVRLKSGDPTVFGRLDEEIEACEAANIEWHIVPGITAASAAVASIGQSLTRRGRNSSVRFVTGHDMKGFAEQDWADLAAPGAVAAVYMGKKAARFVQGRLMIHGADRAMPVTFVENASRPDQRVFAGTLDTMSDDLRKAGFDGPVLTFLGLAPRQAAQTLSDLSANPKMERA